MTGWRLGWMVVPEYALNSIGKLIEFNTSCASLFTQRAGVVAIQRCDEVTPRVVSHLKLCRDTLCSSLGKIQGIELASPRGGMYAFFKINGYKDSLDVAKRLVLDVVLVFSPGEAFAQESRDWFSWCFASKDPLRLTQGIGRLNEWLETNSRF